MSQVRTGVRGWLGARHLERQLSLSGGEGLAAGRCAAFGSCRQPQRSQPLICSSMFTEDLPVLGPFLTLH